MCFPFWVCCSAFRWQTFWRGSVLNEHPLIGPIDKVFALLLFAGLFGALLTKGKRLNVALLVYLVLLYPVASILYQMHVGGGPESGS